MNKKQKAHVHKPKNKEDEPAFPEAEASLKENSTNISDQTRALKEIEHEGDFTFSPIAHYCKDCKTLVKVNEKRKMKYQCKECKGMNVAFGTQRSLINYYKVSVEAADKK